MADSPRPALLRYWWLEAACAMACLLAAADIARDDRLVAVIKVTMMMIFGLGALWLTWSSVLCLRAARAARTPQP